MRKEFLLLFGLFGGAAVLAQDRMFIHQSDHITLGAQISVTDSLYFSSDGSSVYFSISGNSLQYAVSDIDSISFGDNANTIYVTYNGSSVSVINPLAFEGVSVTVENAYVTVTSTTETKDINFELSGTTSAGMFKIYSEKRFNLLLNNANLTNPEGPAINIQANKKATITLMDGTVNTLTDGDTYADPVIGTDGEEEDQDATFFSKGDLVFTGTGSLSLKGNSKHALCSKDLIEIEGGTLVVTTAVKDGIHANDGIVISDGTMNITSSGDAIDADEGYIDISGGSITTVNEVDDSKGLCCDSTLVISGGTINMTVTGDQSKAIKSGQPMTLNGGTITITTSGAAVLETSGSGYDPSYCTAIKCNDVVTISGASITIISTGTGGKGISSDNNLVMTSGTVKVTTTGGGATYRNSSGSTDVYNATCLSADGNISILSGNVTASSSGKAGKGISADGSLTIGDATNSPVITVTTTGSSISVSGMGSNANSAEAKAITCDGAITITNGTVAISSADDGLKSEASITISNATVSISKATEGMEAPYITVNSGKVTIVASDDGFNATKGNGGESNDGSCLYLYGGNVGVNVTTGDGLDSNGNIVMTGGTVVVHGPQSQPEVAFDFNGSFTISGGLLIASGPNSGSMIEVPGTSSSQYSVKVTSSSGFSASTLFRIEDSDQNELVTFKPARNSYYIVFSSAGLKKDSEYNLYTGGSYTGTETNGLYSEGTYSGGTFRKSFTVSDKVTTVSL